MRVTLAIARQLLSFDPLKAHLHLEQWAREIGTPYRVSS